MLTSIKDMVTEAKNTSKIVPGFNVFGYEDAKVVIEVASELNAPVILMSNKEAVNHMPLEVSGAMLKALGQMANVPVALHLDHGDDFDAAKKAINAGYTSVMFDGSKLPFEENVKRTKEVTDYCHQRGISVEAEIGAVGYADNLRESESVYTDPHEAKEFSYRTGVDALAIAIGTLYRMTEQKALLQYDLLREIDEVTDVPLVLHGSTGLMNKDLLMLKEYSIGKMNIGTALRIAIDNGMRTYFNEKLEDSKRLELLSSAMEEARKVVYDKYKRLGW